MTFPANCLLVALVAWLGGAELCAVRNRTRRWHFFWRNAAGEAWEFYTPGASRRSYLRNALTLGRVKRAPALDRARAGRAARA